MSNLHAPLPRGCTADVTPITGEGDAAAALSTRSLPPLPTKETETPRNRADSRGSASRPICASIAVSGVTVRVAGRNGEDACCILICGVPHEEYQVPSSRPPPALPPDRQCASGEVFASRVEGRRVDVGGEAENGSAAAFIEEEGEEERARTSVRRTRGVLSHEFLFRAAKQAKESSARSTVNALRLARHNAADLRST